MHGKSREGGDGVRLQEDERPDGCFHQPGRSIQLSVPPESGGVDLR